jgi:protein O-mannosyl-transferase
MNLSFGRAVAIATLVVAFALLLYSGSLPGTYVFDDLQAFGGNLDRVEFPSLRDWLAPHARPLLQVWFAVISHLSPTPSFAYRVSGVIIHVLNTALLFSLIRAVDHILLSRKEQSHQETPHVDAKAWAVAMIWLVHPICAQAVCSIVQQAELISSTFVLLYLLTIATKDRRSTLINGLLICIFLACGVYTKITMVSAIPLGILLDCVITSQSVSEVVRKHWRLHLLPSASVVLLSIAMIPLLLRGQAGIGVGGDSPPIAIYLLSSFRALCIYASLLAWPNELSIDRGPHFVTSIEEGLPFMLAVLCYVACSITLWIYPTTVRRDERRLASWLMSAPILLLIPTNSIVPTADPVFEHRVYLASAFSIWGISQMLRLVVPTEVQCRTAYRTCLWISCSALTILLSIRTHARCHDYRTPEALWVSALLVDPNNTRAAQNFVATQADRTEGQIIEQLMKVIQSAELSGKPFEASAHQLAKALMRDGQVASAMPILQTLASRQAPPERLFTDRQRREAGERWFDYTIALLSVGQAESAAIVIQQVLAVSPRDPFAHALAGDIRLALGDRAGARSHWQTALREAKENWPELRAKLRELDKSMDASNL